VKNGNYRVVRGNMVVEF